MGFFNAKSFRLWMQLQSLVLMLVVLYHLQTDENANTAEDGMQIALLLTTILGLDTKPNLYKEFLLTLHGAGGAYATVGMAATGSQLHPAVNVLLGVHHVITAPVAFFTSPDNLPGQAATEAQGKKDTDAVEGAAFKKRLSF